MSLEAPMIKSEEGIILRSYSVLRVYLSCKSVPILGQDEMVPETECGRTTRSIEKEVVSPPPALLGSLPEGEWRRADDIRSLVKW